MENCNLLQRIHYKICFILSVKQEDCGLDFPSDFKPDVDLKLDTGDFGSGKLSIFLKTQSAVHVSENDEGNVRYDTECLVRTASMACVD